MSKDPTRGLEQRNDDTRVGTMGDSTDSRTAPTNEAIRAIAHLLGTQDCRCTSWPIYVVEQRKRLYGFDPAYSDTVAWVDACNGYVEADEVKAAELEARRPTDRRLGRSLTPACDCRTVVRRAIGGGNDDDSRA